MRSFVVVLSEYRDGDLHDTGNYWSDKNHSVFLTNMTNLLNTLWKRIMYTCLLYFLFLFINTFIGVSPFGFYDIFFEYFEINF